MPSLYVHVPFCLRKCDYCAFYSVPLRAGAESCQSENSLVQTYLKGLKKEIELRKKDASKGVSSLFIGGGTPTALPEAELAEFLALLKQGFDIPEAAEQTIESNPGTLTPEKLQILKRSGINRISLGVQSFNDSLLKQIGRIHTAADVHKGVKLIREAGFHNLNLDLMFGLPGQTLKDWQETLTKAVHFEPEHLSIYGLMVEEDTPLARNPKLLTILPGDELQAQMYEWAGKYLREAGYNHYETSNFARPGFECRHNLGYWRGNDYLGLGPGAVACTHNVRSKNIEDITQYAGCLEQNHLPIDPAEAEVLSLQNRMTERIILGLRLSEGVNLRVFKQEFGQDIRDIYRSVLERYVLANVLVINDETLSINPDYWFVANGILEEFV